MRVFRTSYKDADGQKVQAKKWYIELRDNLGKVRRFSGFTDKAATESLGHQIKRLVDCRASGGSIDPALSRWLEQIPAKMRQKFAGIGLLDAERVSGGKLLSEHLADFEQYLLAKGDTTRHCRQVAEALRRVFDGCKFRTWNDISATRFLGYLAGEKQTGKISQRTFNFYVKVGKCFDKWMVQHKRASEYQLAVLPCEKITEQKRKRRALEPDEIRRLLEATMASGESFRVSGAERALLYRFAIETGLRANELRSLKAVSFDFSNRTLTVEASNSKNRTKSVLPLRRDTAAQLQQFVAGKLPQTQVFRVPVRTADMLYADLEAAKIDHNDNGRGVVDFHSLRHTTGSLLAASGVHPKVAQSLMRHSDINLTMSRYTHTLTGQEAQAINSLPDLLAPSSQSQRAAATGTDGEKALCLAREDGHCKNSIGQLGKDNRNSDSENAVLNGRCGSRTHDPLIKSQLLYRLS